MFVTWFLVIDVMLNVFWKYSKCKNTSKVKVQSKKRLFKCAHFFNRIIDYWYYWLLIDIIDFMMKMSILLEFVTGVITLHSCNNRK